MLKGKGPITKRIVGNGGDGIYPGLGDARDTILSNCGTQL